MVSTQAWEVLNDPEYCGKLTMNQYHGLLLKAGYSRDHADEAALQRGWDRLSAGEVV